MSALTKGMLANLMTCLTSCAFAASAYAADSGTIGRTQWWTYTPQDIATGNEMHHQTGSWARLNGEDWTTGPWYNFQYAHFGDAIPDTVQPGCMMYGPYLNLRGKGDIKAEIYMDAVFHPSAPVSTDSALWHMDFAKIDLVTDGGTRVLDQLNLNMGNHILPDRQDQFGNGTIHLQALNVTDAMSVEVRVCEVIYSAQIAISALKIEFEKK